MTIKIYDEVVQGSEEWYAVRCGVLTASEMKLIITPKTLAYASNDKERAHLYELAAQRITKFVEPHYVGDDMLRGHDDEIEARALYEKHYAPVRQVGFITNDKFGFSIGYSPDGLIDEDGQIEGKSRKQKFQIEAIVTDTMPTEHVIQVQTGLIVSERKWCDYLSYCGGLPMFKKRIYADEALQAAIVAAAMVFEDKMKGLLSKYNDNLSLIADRLIPTVRRVEAELAVGTYE